MATSPMTWTQFQAIPNGTPVFNHGWDECVALANLYQESVLGQPFVAVGSAYQWWTLFRNYPALYNTYKQSGVPIAGAVVVSRYGIYDAPNGHIEVVTSVNSDGSFNTMGQNASGHRYVWRYRRTMQNILGFLHPYNNPATSTPEKIRTILEDQMSNPIISVPDSRGTLYIGTDQGEFVPYATPNSKNSRAIISKAFLGGPGGNTDTIPALSWVDFKVAQTVWRQMRTGKP